MNKNWIKKGLLTSRAMSMAGKLKGPSAAILMYHSVMDDPSRESQTLGGIIHSTAVFTRQMELLAREFVPISLDDLLSALADGRPLRPRSVVVTFDDGYTDNLEVAVPILNGVGVPATFYITVDCVETRSLPWPSRLRYAFYTTKEASWSDTNGIFWPLSDFGERDRAFLSASDRCAQLAGEPQFAFVHKVEKDLGAAPQPSQRLMMTWNQVRDLAKSGHIVGSHTLTHPNMAYVDASSAKRELADSKRQLETVLQNPVVHFSYPCPALSPHWNKSTRKMSEEVGYRTAVTTVGGPVTQQDDPLSLHRVRPSKDLDGFTGISNARSWDGRCEQSMRGEARRWLESSCSTAMPRLLWLSRAPWDGRDTG
jgi:peptidoglycan/xylan/chitin deacetylase (PgdA/CDA1 family)